MRDTSAGIQDAEPHVVGPFQISMFLTELRLIPESYGNNATVDDAEQSQTETDADVASDAETTDRKRNVLARGQMRSRCSADDRHVTGTGTRDDYAGGEDFPASVAKPRETGPQNLDPQF